MCYSSVCAESKQKQKSNTSLKSVKTLRLFVCTHNNNKTCFCKIMKANRMRFLPSRSVNLSVNLCVYLCLTDIKNIYIESEMSTFKWTNSNRKQIFSDSVWNLHTGASLLQRWWWWVSVPTSSLKLRTKKALVYQWIIKTLLQPPWHIHNHYFCRCCGKLYACTWVLMLCRQLKTRYKDLNGL